MKNTIQVLIQNKITTLSKKRWRNISIAQKLIWIFVMGTVIPLIIVTEVSFHIFIKNLENSSKERLITISSKKSIEIQTYIDEQILDISQLSFLSDVISDIILYKNIYERSGLNSLEYRQFDEQRYTKYKKFMERAGYYDLFFISPAGRVIFTIAREADFGSDLSDGDAQGSGLKKVFRLTRSTLSPSVSSFEYYGISDVPASFIAIPIFFNQQVVGYLALQLNLERVLALVSDKTGMGSTGETLIIKKTDRDIYLADWQRTRSVQSLFQNINNLPIKNFDLFVRAVSGEHASGISIDQKGREVIAVWQYLPSLKWGMIVKQDTSEIFFRANKIRLIGYLITLLALLFGSLLTFILSFSIVEPVNALTRATSLITLGQQDIIIETDRDDEIGSLGKSFEAMRVWLQTTLHELGDVNANMRQQAKELVYAKENLENQVVQRTREIMEISQRTQDILNNTTSLISLKDMNGKFLMVNDAYLKFAKKNRSEIIGHTVFDLFPEHVARRIQEGDQVVIESRKTIEAQDKVPIEGLLNTYLNVKFPLFNDKNELYAVCGISTDITRQVENNEKLILAAKVFDHAQEAIIVTDKDNRIVDINPYYTLLMGYTREEMIGGTPAQVKSDYHDDEFYKSMWKSIHETGGWSGEIWDRRKNGEIFPEWLTISSIVNEAGEVTHYLGIFSDISLQKETEQKLEQMAYYDALTKLPNRSLFQERMNQAILHGNRSKGSFAVLFIDLDKFKDINDSLGHSVGDLLLVEVAKRIKNCIRSVDTVSRIGGDEFTIILSDIQNNEPDHDIVAKISQSIINDLEEKYILKGQEVYVSASIGISIFPDDGTEFQTLTKNADTAMYQAKSAGRSNYKFFTQSMNISITKRLLMENNLRKAIVNNEFILMYQPKYNLIEKTVVGYEALIRWNHPEDGLISPLDFNPLAEESKIIIPMGEFVIDQVCRDLPYLVRQNPSIRVAINLSPGQFKDSNLISQIDKIVLKHKVSSENLEFEITESAIDNPAVAIEKMLQLVERGYFLSMDDFGKGYSSLSFLKKFPIHTLKIDKSFIDDIPGTAEDVAITSAIISMAKALGLNLVAEGVETQRQVDFLLSKECEVIQGYYYSMPKLVEELKT